MNTITEDAKELIPGILAALSDEPMPVGKIAEKVLASHSLVRIRLVSAALIQLTKAGKVEESFRRERNGRLRSHFRRK